jgi:FkbM family methyltransferase
LFGGKNALVELSQRRVIVAAVTGLQHIKLWIAFPDITENDKYMGVEWYNPFLVGKLMNEYGVVGLHAIDTILTAYPCSPSSYVLQAGAHLGINTLIASVAGCHAIAIEGFRQHSHYAAMSAALNGVSHLYHPVHALVGARELFSVPFAGFDLSKSNGVKENVPMVTIDGVTREARAIPGYVFPLVVIDIEGFEADAMLGAVELLASGQVLFWNIEIWLAKGGIRREAFPFITSLEKAGYVSLLDGKAVNEADLVSTARSTAEHDKSVDILAVSSKVPRIVLDAVVAACIAPDGWTYPF